MKNYPLISASLLIGSLVISSCSTNKLATSKSDDNLYFMASDVKLATQFAVDNNNPQSFKNISQEPDLAEQNFSSRNVNPDYISRYQTTENSATSDDGVVYFDEGTTQQTNTGNINAYDNYSAAGNGINNANGFNSPNINFNIGMGFGMGGMMMSPWGFYDPFWGPAWGFRPGLSFGLGFGWGNPMWNMGIGFGNPMWGMGMGMGWGMPMYPAYGWGMPMYPAYGYGGYPVYPGNPSYVLPGGEYGDRRVVTGARPTRGSSMTNTGIRSGESGVMPSTARAQARGNAAASATNPSARRTGTFEDSRGATRDFGNSQNDYYNSRSRTATTRNINSPVTDRGTATTRSSSTAPSARTSNAYNPSNDVRNYSQGRGSTPSYNSRTSDPTYNRSTSPSYNRNSTPTYNNRSTTNPTYNRSGDPSNSRSVTTPSRSNYSPSYSAPSRSSGGSMSAPSRSSGGYSGGSSGGYSGGSSGGSRGGRGN